MAQTIIKDDFNTPYRRSTRAREQRTPNAPIKEISEHERKIVDPQDLAELNALQDEISHRLWLHADSIKPPETILAKLREFRKMYRTTSFKNEDPIKDHKILQVVDMSPMQVSLIIGTLRRKARTEGFPMPSRADGSQKFSIYLDSWVLLRGKEFNRHKEESEQYKITYELVTLIYKLCRKLKSMKLREIYYSNTKLYKNVKIVSEAVNDLCCMIGCTRSSLCISASEKGIVYGDISFSVGDQNYNGFAGGAEGINIPSDTSLIQNINSVDALFILVVEKDTIFERLAEDGFCKTYHCIMITGKGMPDVATRSFLSIIRNKLKLPVFALMDCNPYGLRIYAVYRYGSNAMSYDRENLTTPDIKLLGIRYKDIDKYQILEESKEELTDDDKMTASDLLDRQYMKEYHGDLQSMLYTGKKIQIEALYSHDVEYLAECALPLMLDEKLSELYDESILECEI